MAKSFIDVLENRGTSRYNERNHFQKGRLNRNILMTAAVDWTNHRLIEREAKADQPNEELRQPHSRKILVPNPSNGTIMVLYI